MADRKFAVFGAGGVGGYFAAVLARAGFDVSLVTRGRHLEAIRQSGLKVESPKGNFTVRMSEATDKPAEVGPVDAVILGVKSWQVPEAAEALRPLLRSDTKVLPLQNGVEAPEQLAEILGRQHALIGMCRIIASIAGPGHIRHGGVEPTILLGEFDGASLSSSAKALADALTAAGVVVDTPANIQTALWEKLLFIAAVSGVGAVARANIGEMRACPPTRELLRHLMSEVTAVGRARGIYMTDDGPSRALAFIDGMPANGTASMQRDIAEGRPSELEAIVGAVVRLGDQAGVDTPAMDFVYACLLPQEQRARQASIANVA
ncbi:MAG: 2-dehydropantoate 2-reductase [Acidobacteriales bacterium]|nr:2-dehydropantoate 2-reductase [Terriglobales bacterium]